MKKKKRQRNGNCFLETEIARLFVYKYQGVCRVAGQHRHKDFSSLGGYSRTSVGSAREKREIFSLHDQVKKTTTSAEAAVRSSSNTPTYVCTAKT